MSLVVSVEGDEPVEGLAELSDWLSAEPELRGLMRQRVGDVEALVRQALEAE